MDLSLFNYTYPEDLIAQHPLPERDASRLLVIDPRGESWEHRRFTDFASYFGPEDLLVFNNVKVFPARLYGKTKDERQVEVLLLNEMKEGEWSCLVRPAKKLGSAAVVQFAENFVGVLEGVDDQWTIRFQGHDDVRAVLSDIGLPPLPPYIKRDNPVADKQEDAGRYQTLYAEEFGAAAAPTAGFHFTDRIFDELRRRGCEICFITLNVGRDTFQPVRVERIEDHQMHGESFEIPRETRDAVARAKKEGRRITAIGTTTVRALESAWDSVGARSPRPGGETAPLHAGNGYTEKFIYPGYKFQIVDRLLTNFHQPKSTLLMLVSAFAGREFLLDAYKAAIEERYRLFSFGDAMLILNCAEG